MKLRNSFSAMVTLFLVTAALFASDVAKPAVNQALSFDAVVDRISLSEAQFNRNVRQYVPVVETYIQNLQPDKELGAVPKSDAYFLGRLDLDEGEDASMLPRKRLVKRVSEKMTGLFHMSYLPMGFAQMIFVDGREFDRQHYNFKFVRREFLGDLRCLVIDVQPKPDTGIGRFLGRIWVEDQDYNVVRFNGTFWPAPRFHGYYLHFDSWRLNMQPGLWLPAYVYSEESDAQYSVGPVGRPLRFKAQTRLWGYDLRNPHAQQEFTSMTVEPSEVNDQSEGGQDLSPVQARRAWERLAEDNVVARLEKAGMLAPSGEVDKVLQTVANNIEITNNLNITPGVRARVLLTTPMESFTVGQTIVISRGLLDVLPDEATLAIVVAHELAHIALGHHFDTKYAFSDRMIFNDDAALRNFEFHRDSKEEQEADAKALALLQKSPYKDKLPSAGLFLRSLASRQQQLPNLVRAHLGNSLAAGHSVRMADLMGSAPQLEVRSLEQVASLPLGGRIRVDPWSDRIELIKARPVQLLSPQEKMPFEVTPVYPYLTRFARPGTVRMAGNAGGSTR